MGVGIYERYTEKLESEPEYFNFIISKYFDMMLFKYSNFIIL